MSGWTRGRAEILGMIERGELTQVTANAELAERLLATARQHAVSARLLATSDPYLAYAALHDAIRKALSALLQVQGLRATTSGGHLAVTHAVQAQFGASMGAILRPVDRIRVTRHEAEYPGPATYIDEDTVRDDLPHAEAVIEVVAKTLPHLPVFSAEPAGEQGPVPHDVDVLLIGQPDRDAVFEAARRAEERLGREVNVTIRDAERWENAADGFTGQLRSSPLVEIPLADSRD